MSELSVTSDDTYTNLLSRGFAWLAAFSYDYSRWIVLLMAIFIFAVVAILGQLKMDLSAEGRLHPMDPLRVVYDSFRQQFGRDDHIVVTLPAAEGIHPALIEQLQQLQQTIETQIPYVSEVTSILNARYTYGEEGELIIEELLEGDAVRTFQQRWPEHALTTFLQESPNYRERLISTDGKAIAMVIELQAWVHSDIEDNYQPITQAQTAEAVRAIRAQVASFSQLGDMAVTGRPVVNEALTRRVFNDTNMTGGLAGLLMIGFLFFFFRRLSGVLIPLLVISSSILSAVGFMVINDAPWLLNFGTLPPIMIAIGVADSVHILSAFYKRYDAADNKRQAIVAAISHSAPAVLLTSMTTAAGFLSFAAADLASIASLGIYTAIAVAFALLYSVVLIPALLALFPIKVLVRGDVTLAWVEGFTEHCVRFSCRFRKSVTLLAVMVLIVGVFSALRLGFSDDVISVFPDSEKAKQDFFSVDQAFHGAANMEVMIDSGAARGVIEPLFLQKLEQASQALSNRKLAGVEFADSYSLLNILKETHKALNGNQPAYYRLADDQQTLAQELLLFDLSEHDDLMKVVDEEYRYTRMTLKMTHADGVIYQQIIEQMQVELDQWFGTGNAHITGATALLSESIPRALKSMLESYVIALVVITLLMGVMIANLRIGIISMLPNLLPIVLILNMMLLLDWPLDQTTISIGAIALGLVVDDTLHFLYHFKQNWEKLGDATQAALASVRGCGTALFITSVIFACASLTNTLSSLHPFIVFGISLGLVSILALLADLLIAPAVLAWVFDNSSRPLPSSASQKLV